MGLALVSFHVSAGPNEKAQLQKTVEDRLENAFSKIIGPHLFVLSVDVVEKSKGVAAPKVQAAAPSAAPKVDQNDFLSKMGFESGQTNPTFESAEVRAADWLEEIKVKITFDDSIKDESVKLLEEIASDMIGSLQDKKVRISTNKVSFAALASVKIEKAFDSGWDQKRWLFEMGIPLGIVFAGIIIAFFALLSVFIFMSKFAKVEKQKMTLFESFIAIQAEKSVAGEVIEDSSAVSEHILIGHDAAQAALPDRSNGLDSFTKFQTLISEQPERALRLVQQWLHGKALVNKETLAVLARNITPLELAHLFKDLKDEERREWRRALRINIDGSVHARVEDFLSQQIVDVMIVAKSSPEESIMGVLGKMGMEDFVKVAETDSNLGAALLNILSPEQASKLVSLLPSETFKTISIQALNYREEDLADVGVKLEAAAKKIRSETKEEISSPFMERIPALLREADANKEEVLFSALVDAKEYVLLQDLGVQNFPSALVPKLPHDFIKAVLMSMPSSSRAELLFGMEEELKNYFLDSLGEATSKARTMITDEIDEIKEDALRCKRLESKKNDTWTQFLKRVRGSIVSRPDKLEVAKKIVQDWIQEIGGPSSDEQQDTGAQAA